MDNSFQYYQLDGDPSVGSFQTQEFENENYFDLFTNGKDGLSKTLLGLIEDDEFWNEQTDLSSFQNQNKVLDSFLCPDQTFFDNKEDYLVNETVEPCDPRAEDVYSAQNEIPIEWRESPKTDDSETVKTDNTLNDPEKKEEVTKLKLGIKCNSCEKIFGNRRDFVAHYKNCCDKVTEFTCSICDKCFKNYLSFRSHWYRHNPHKHKCSYCVKVFNLRTQLLSHEIAVHSDFRPYLCKICNKGYASQSSLNCHEKTHNQKLTTYTCNICHKEFVSNQSFSRHVKLHKLGRCFMCEVCGDRFSYKSHLLDHLSNLHAVERPFICEKCGKTFAEIIHLKRHLKLHREDRPYKCDDCFKTFKTKNCLNHHGRWHKAKPFVCSMCNKGFVRMSKLKEHYNTHTGDRPFSCKFCDRTFTNNSNLIKHTRRIHQKKENSDPLADLDITSSLPFTSGLPSDLDLGQDFSFMDSFPSEFL